MSRLSDQEFNYISDWLYLRSGIRLKPVKRQLITGRLDKRLRAQGFDSYREYFQMMASSKAEQEFVINQLTTNETYFFREKQHFDFLQTEILPELKKQARCNFWSAAASIGAEAYTLAFCLADRLGVHGNWQIMASDINTDVLRHAMRGVYPISFADKIPPHYLKAYCLKGKGKDSGFMKIHPELIAKVTFLQMNLFERIPLRELFDVVFLRNMLIYFDPEEKARILDHVVERIRPGGWLIVGHSESIYGFNDNLEQLGSGCYRRQ